MSWLKRIAQLYSVEEIIQGVLTRDPKTRNTFDINWAAQYLGETHGMDCCPALEYAAGADSTALPKMRALAQGAGCPTFDPALPGQPEETVQPGLGVAPESVIAPELGAQEKPMNMPSVEIA